MTRFNILCGIALVSCALLVGCGGSSGPAVTTISPDPGPFSGTVEVKLSTDKPATIFVTTDGSDPKVDGPKRKSGDGSVTLELTQTTTVTFYSHTADGADEQVRTAQFFLSGTISGVVVVDTIALGHQVALFVDGAPMALGTTATRNEIPFSVANLKTGTHLLRAMADRNDDGTFSPVVDVTSDQLSFDLDLTNPLKASADNVRIMLGTSTQGLCSIAGTVKLPKPVQGETVRVSAVTASSFTSGGDPTALLSQLQSGDQIVVNGSQTSYPYGILNLQPGSYIPAPILTSVDGLSINVVAQPLSPIDCQAGETKKADLEYGPAGISGTVTLTPATAPSGAVTGIVAGRFVNMLQAKVQLVMMPVLFTPSSASQWTGTYKGSALLANSNFTLRAFTTIDSQNPITDALTWAANPLGGQPGHATVTTTSGDTTKDFSVP
jgi:hypothetical protein